METTNMIVNGKNKDLVADPVPFARSYQLEALEIALKQNTLVFFETGTGKTLIAIMLLRSYAHFLRKPSSYIAVFLVPTVVLVTQQAEAVEMHTDLKVGKYYGEMGVDFWDAATWKNETEKYEVLVMTHQILLDALRHAYVSLNQIKVLVFDECHNARGKHQYACIMTEFYHRELALNSGKLPRVFGMTASPIKAKASSSEEGYWKQISELENLMNSKVFTCDSDSVLTQYVPLSTPKVKIYNHVDIPHSTLKCLEDNLTNLIGKHELSLNREESASAKKRLNKALSTFLFCLTELGVWLAMKAAEVYSREEEDIHIWGENRGMGVSGHGVVRAFSLDAAKVFSESMPSGPHWSIRSELTANVRAGYISSKVMCLVQTLLEYRELKDLRCIIFVQRIVTAIVISNLLNELLPELSGWKTEYTAGNNYRMQTQSRKEQATIVDKFRKGTVNIIVSTSMLEEGLDVQSCNLVIRFDPSVTVCSFIQSRGRARMQNSDFILMVKSGDDSSLSCVKKYLSCGDTMRRECLSHVDIPCMPISKQMFGEPWYQVGSTGAIVTLNSSVQLLNFYCDKLPSDGYFKPSPRCTIDEVLKTCTLQLPNSCPIQTITVQADTKSLKQLACLEACKKLHEVGALTDNLVPDVVEEEAQVPKKGKEPYLVECATYFPPELIGCENQSEVRYYCYLIELKPDFQYDIKVQDIVLAVRTKLDDELEKLDLDLDVDRGKLTVNIKHIGYVTLNPDQVALCQRFQISLFRVLIDHNLNNLQNELDRYSQRDGSTMFSYLLLPSVGSHPHRSIDWKCINAVVYQERAFEHTDSCSSRGSALHTKNGLVCCCMLENSLVCTPHNGVLYCLSGILEGYDGNTFLEVRDGEAVTYKKYYERKHGIKLRFEREPLFKAKRIFTVHNYLHRCRKSSTKESSNYSTCELPPELCLIVMSPISVSTIYSFSFIPSIMHRIESLLLAANLKSTHTDHCTQNEFIPTLKVLEAITTKKCQENFHLESLETLGDSFLKYAASQQLFKTYQNRHEGLLSIKREKIISNASLCKLGCDHKIMGFIRNEQFNPKTWIIPGSKCANYILEEEMLSSKRKVYIGSNMNIKSKRVADVVEALIGAFLSAGGEIAALFFMKWLGIDVDFVNVPYTRNFAVKPELHINIKYLESLLKYKFKDASLLVEALTHGSYMLPEIPGCYQRLEFLGDAVLDYLITVHLYLKYPGLSPGLLTDLRSASVNNDCYAQSAIKAKLNKHILHISPELQRQINHSVCNFDKLSLESTFGWESSTAFPKVLGDVIESIAGAIFVDSGYDKEIVFQSMRPLLEPLITPETLRLHPVRELTELCQKENYTLKKPLFSRQNGLAYATVEVEAKGVVFKETCSDADRKMAKKLAYRAVLKSLKDRMSTG